MIILYTQFFISYSRTGLRIYFQCMWKVVNYIETFGSWCFNVLDSTSLTRQISHEKNSNFHIFMLTNLCILIVIVKRPCLCFFSKKSLSGFCYLWNREVPQSQGIDFFVIFLRCQTVSSRRYRTENWKVILQSVSNFV